MVYITHSNGPIFLRRRKLTLTTGLKRAPECYIETIMIVAITRFSAKLSLLLYGKLRYLAAIRAKMKNTSPRNSEQLFIKIIFPGGSAINIVQIYFGEYEFAFLFKCSFNSVLLSFLYWHKCQLWLDVHR
jgi:hypothetical protein